MPGLKLMAELGLDGNGFAAGFRQAKGLAAGAGEGIKHLVVGAVGIGTVEEAIRRTVETAKELVDSSERLAIAPEQLQVMREAAKQSNVEFEKLAETFEKINIARQRALIPGNEGKDARRAFSGLGIGVDQLRTQGGAQLFMGAMRQAALNRNPQELGIIFRELGIKAFGGLIPVLKTNFEELEASMRKVGALMDTETAVKLKRLSDEFGLLGKIITSQFGPILIKLAETMYSALLKISKGAAGAAGFYGAATAGQSPAGAAATMFKAFFLGPLAVGAGFMTKPSWGLQEKLMDWIFKGTDVAAGKKAQIEAEQPWQKDMDQFAAFQKRMKEEADKLDRPTPANLESTLAPKMTNKALEAPTNSLLRIGNFLGSNQGMINQINQRKVQLLQIIANNTKQRAAPRQSTFVGDAEPTFFPTA